MDATKRTSAPAGRRRRPPRERGAARRGRRLSRPLGAARWRRSARRTGRCRSAPRRRAGADAAPAPHRVGEPSPLIFHLGAALAAYASGAARGAARRQPELSLGPGLAEAGRGARPDLDQIEVAREIAAPPAARRSTGLEIWQAHPYRRTLADPPAIWREGCSRLLDYGAAPEAADPDGPPVLVVPSLINRAYVLDLVPGRSMLRWLAAPGPPAAADRLGRAGPAPRRGFDLDAYGARAAAAGARRRPRGGRRRRWRCSATAWAARWPPGWPRAAPDGVAGARHDRRALGLRLDPRHRRRPPRDDPRRGARRAPSGCSTASARPSAWCRSRCSRCSSRWSTRCRRR